LHKKILTAGKVMASFFINHLPPKLSLAREALPLMRSKLKKDFLMPWFSSDFVFESKVLNQNMCEERLKR